MNVREGVSYEVALRLVELVPGVCFVFSRDGTIEYANSEMERVLGYAAEDIPGLSIWNLIHPGDSQELEHVLRDLTESVEVEARVRASDGTYRRLQWEFLSAGDRIFGRERDQREPHGELSGYTREEHEAEMLESIGVLAGGIAHDFNNLLTGIIGNASLAAQDLPRGDPSRRLIEDVIRAGQRAAVLTQQLLAYAGKGGFAISTLDLSETVAGMVHVLRASLPKTVQLELDLPTHLPQIEADVRQVQQIAYNLLINAVEALDGQGTIRVVTGQVQLKHGIDAAPRFVSPGEYVFFQVEDTGMGMDDHVKARIFDPFFTTKFTGRGLGLAAVSGFVRAHKGGIEIMTAPGQGSTFRVLLPVPRISEESLEATHPHPDSRTHSAESEVWEQRAPC